MSRDSDVAATRYRPTLCACKTWCGDVPEADDDLNAICKSLPLGYFGEDGWDDADE